MAGTLFIVLVLIVLVLVIVAGLAAAVLYDYALDKGRRQGRVRVQQEAVDRGFGAWTIIAAVNTFQWDEPNDPPHDPNSATAAPSGEGSDGGAGATHDY